MRFGSVCSGIEAASVAWQPLGWKAAWLAEIEPFPCSVLAHHYPDTPNLGDMTKFNDWPTDDKHAIDLLCGGTPCQSFSVAGLRKGLDDPRGNLMLTFGAIASKYRPQWLVWENVPGVLSSNGGRDFGSFLGMLGQLGYGFAYRVLDAQYFGVAQRRRRVFVVGCLGDWHSAAAVLFERHSLQGHPAPSREKGKVAPTIPSRSTAGGGLGTDFDCDGGLIPSPRGVTIHGTDKTARVMSYTDIAGSLRTKPPGSIENSSSTAVLQPFPHAAISPALKARDHKGVSSDGDGDGAIIVPMLAHSLRGEAFDASEDGTGRGTPLVPVNFQASQSGMRINDTVGTIDANYGGRRHNGVMVPLAFDTTQITSAASRSNPQRGDPCHPLAAGAHAPAIAFPANLSGTQCASTEELAPSMGAANPTAVAHVSIMPTMTAGGPSDTSHNQVSGQMRDAYMVPTTAMQVRRLTPVECERLQGFPDNWTLIPWRNKPAADGPRYKSLGNSWAVPNVRWIGERIEAVAQINSAQAAAKDVAEMEAA